MALDSITTDPIISTENAAFTPSPSPILVLALPSELDPLVGPPRKPFYRARPLWLVPFAFIASLARGMTLASRVEVFTELSCAQLHNHFNHTSTLDVWGHPPSLHPPLDATPTTTSIYLPSILPGLGLSKDNDPRVIPGRRCVSDPAVQAGAARLQTIMTTTMGALSALTTGWWGRFGERHGRTRVLAISTFGLFLTDLIFILVSTPHNLLATHSHKLLILAPIVEGLTGGWSSLASANTAYIADCTSPGSRATIFARFTGVLSVGLALGPIIGAWLIRNPIPFLKVGPLGHPLPSVNSVFWVAICGFFVNFLLVLFVFPESLPASRRATNRKGKNRAIEGYDFETCESDKHTWIVTRIVKSFISPLAVFLPTDVPVARAAVMPNKPLTRKDWSLTFLGLSFFFYVLASGLIQIKYLYAEHVYNWAAEQLSYYISFTGGVRAFHLLVLLPFLLTAFKPVRAAVSAQPAINGPKAKPKPTKSHLFSEIRFDLLVIRCSMLVDFCSHAFVLFAPLPPNDAAHTWWSQCLFVGATSLASAGAGVTPAVQSMALSTLQGRKLADKDMIARLQGGAARISVEQDTAPEAGKLLGAFAVVQAVGQTILGPIVFGVIYSSTVASFPRAIFATAAVLVMAAIVLTVFVRPDVSLSIPKNRRKKTKPGATLRHVAEETRGRPRASKDLRGGSASASYGATRYGTSTSTSRTEVGTSRLV